MRQLAGRFGKSSMVSVLLLLLVAGVVTGFPSRQRNVAHKPHQQHHHPHHHHGLPSQTAAQKDEVQFTSQELEEQNLVQSLLPETHSPQRRGSHPQHRSVEVLPQPEPEEETKPFILDLKNFPEQNPNIQVTIEVKLFWPLFWGYTDADEEPLPSGVGGDWDSNWNEGWDPIQSYYEKESDEWSSWTPCSVTCGHGERKRTKSCGYSCTLTEASRCDQQPCPNDAYTLVEPFPMAMENGTEPFGTDVDTCEKWLSCKSAFLQRYLHQALSELPSCPCSYPSAAAYAVVSVQDEGHGWPFRWRDASGPKERLDVYKPSARSCIRSALSGASVTLAAQHCCYDEHGRLLTRGKGAGTPDLISAEFSAELHFKVDVLPWILCKGDWSRFQAVRPPNRGLACPENPHQDVFLNELEEATEF
ncbi:hypothetical protein NHX12_026455 [Muraenolepis orangiensis]|uniref:AMOP domain-containing protein n=1 Tax=Muraenolepis orangiensis TaxID=630683 RepID=A0A9Q0IQA1_9TELE|nr:hypothetical protein NHX12_026455 [Muraenolepis orangiensis]